MRPGAAQRAALLRGRRPCRPRAQRQPRQGAGGSAGRQHFATGQPRLQISVTGLVRHWRWPP